MAGGNVAEVILKAVDQASSTIGKVGGNLSNLAEKAKPVGMAMTAAGAAIVGSLGLAVKSAANYGEALQTASQQTGIAVEAVAELQFAAEQSNVAFDSLRAGLFRAGKAADAAAQDGASPAAEAFERLGISVTDAQGNLVGTEELFLRIADGLKGIPNEGERGAIAMELFGRSGRQLLPLLMEGSEGIREFGKRARELGIVMSGDAAKAADDFNDQLEQVKLSVKGLAVQVWTALGPSIQKLAEWTTNLVAGFAGWAKAHPALTQGVLATAAALGVLMLQLGTLILVLPTLVKGWNLLLAVGPKVLLFLRAMPLVIAQDLLPALGRLVAVVRVNVLGSLSGMVAAMQRASAAMASFLMSPTMAATAQIALLVAGIAAAIKIIGDWGKAQEKYAESVAKARAEARRQIEETRENVKAIRQGREAPNQSVEEQTREDEALLERVGGSAASLPRKLKELAEEGGEDAAAALRLLRRFRGTSGITQEWIDEQEVLLEKKRALDEEAATSAEESVGRQIEANEELTSSAEAATDALVDASEQRQNAYEEEGDVLEEMVEDAAEWWDKYKEAQAGVAEATEDASKRIGDAHRDAAKETLEAARTMRDAAEGVALTEEKAAERVEDTRREGEWKMYEAAKKVEEAQDPYTWSDQASGMKKLAEAREDYERTVEDVERDIYRTERDAARDVYLERRGYAELDYDQQQAAMERAQRVAEVEAEAADRVAEAQERVTQVKEDAQRSKRGFQRRRADAAAAREEADAGLVTAQEAARRAQGDIITPPTETVQAQRAMEAQATAIQNLADAINRIGAQEVAVTVNAGPEFDARVDRRIRGREERQRTTRGSR